MRIMVAFIYNETDGPHVAGVVDGSPAEVIPSIRSTC